MSPMTADTVFLLDVDNTLLDNDRVIADMRQHLHAQFGAAADGYWTAFEALRAELGYADYLGALQRFRAGFEHDPGSAHRLLSTSGFLIDYPFAERLYPKALAVVARLCTLGTTVILSDGDVVFQPRKVQRSGLWDTVDGRVLIYIHKERMLEAVERRFPARRYVMVDDKLRILRAMKDIWRDRLVTVFPRQGHYASDPAQLTRYGAADVSVRRIGDLLDFDFDFVIASSPGSVHEENLR
ncbi:MAG: HAD family hydrolase [Burkholderiales bacterium]